MPFKKEPLHILLAPNAFKNSLPADEVAAALAEGLLQSHYNGTVSCCPVGDGGDGTAAMLALHLKARPCFYKTFDPLGRPITAPVYYTKDHTAIIELADTSGLKLLKPSVYDPLHANTFGTGILIKKALARRVNKILLAIGGSATVDGGAGILSALGLRFFRQDGIEIKASPQELAAAHYIDASLLDSRLQQTEIVVLCDVKNKLLGKNGAARVFGPQKGATATAITKLEKALQVLDRIVYNSSGIKMSRLDYSGAAGGVAASLAATCGATPVNGIDYFLDTIQFDEQLKKAHIVITGEGSIDAQTLQGKAPLGVALSAKKAGIKVIGVGGSIDLTHKKLKASFDELICINTSATSLNKAIKDTRTNLVKTGKSIGSSIVGQ